MKDQLNIYYFSAIQIGAPDAGNNHTLEICKQLSDHGHSINLFVPKSSSKYNSPEKIRLIMTPAIGKPDTLLRTFTFYLFLPLAAWKYFARQQPDVLYTRFSFLEYLSVLPLRLCYKPVHVAEINGIRSLESHGMRLKRKIINQLERLSLILCDAVIAVTPELADWVLETTHLPREKIAVIGNGVAVDRFIPRTPAEVCDSLGLDSEVVYLNFTGSLKSWHGTRAIIETLSQIINRTQKQVQLLIIGDGPEKAALQAYSKKLGLEESIRWVGRVSNDKVPDFINASTICLAPITPDENTRVGRSSLKIFEYMSCAKPIITTRIGAAYDELIANGGFGILVPPNDTTALADAILELLNDPIRAKTMGEKGRQAVLDHFSWEKIAQQTEKFLNMQLKQN